MRVYFISGLGADERIFQNLQLPETWQVTHIQWPPITEKETLTSFCEKISGQIDITDPNFSIVGVSFGGIVTVELSKMLHPAHTIILSGITNREEMPFYYRWAALLQIHRVIPARWLKKTNFLTYWFFGAGTEQEKELLRQIITDTDPYFLAWAIDQLLNWDNLLRPAGLYHIHGSADRLFPVKNTKADYIIPREGHFMVYSSAVVISGILQQQLSPL